MNKFETFKCSLSAKSFLLLTLLILLIATSLRFYELGNIPHGMTWDEAAIGYNGYAIFTTRRDEWLKRLPISFWSFGDYKAPFAIYLNGLFTFLFGMNLWAVRFPFAVSGVLSVLGLILFVKQFLIDEEHIEEETARFWAIVAGGFLTFSPWHLHFSRAGFESGMALMFLIWGLYFWQRYWNNQKLWLVLSGISFILAIYTYHSAKITIPLLILILVWQKRKKILSNLKQIIMAGLIAGGLLTPFIYVSIFGMGLQRAGTLVFSQGLNIFVLCKTIIFQTITHLSPKFLFFGETTTLRHGDGHWGVLLITTGILGLVAIFKFLIKHKKSPLFSLSTVLIVTGLLPAILGTEVPHSNRALLALPGFLLLAVVGLRELACFTNPIIQRSILGSFLLFHSLLAIAYLHDYYTIFARESATAFQDGYLEAFTYLIPFEKGQNGNNQVDKIVFSSDYGQPYIYALFARKTNPIWYQGGSLIRYEFKDEVTIGDLERENTIVVASNKDDLLGKNDKADKIIYGSDGSERFRIYLNLTK